LADKALRTSTRPTDSHTSSITHRRRDDALAVRQHRERPVCAPCGQEGAVFVCVREDSRGRGWVADAFCFCEAGGCGYEMQRAPPVLVQNPESRNSIMQPKRQTYSNFLLFHPRCVGIPNATWRGLSHSSLQARGAHGPKNSDVLVTNARTRPPTPSRQGPHQGDGLPPPHELQGRQDLLGVRRARRLHCCVTSGWPQACGLLPCCVCTQPRLAHAHSAGRVPPYGLQAYRQRDGSVGLRVGRRCRQPRRRPGHARGRLAGALAGQR
jgi:hypothetical protein